MCIEIRHQASAKRKGNVKSTVRTNSGFVCYQQNAKIHNQNLKMLPTGGLEAGIKPETLGY